MSDATASKVWNGLLILAAVIDWILRLHVSVRLHVSGRVTERVPRLPAVSESAGASWWHSRFRCYGPTGGAAYRRWPRGSPSTRAFCLSAPGVRFVVFEITATGVLSSASLAR